MEFLKAFRAQVESRNSTRGRRFLKRLERRMARMRPAKRERFLARLDAEARAHSEVTSSWGAVGERDWSKFFESLLEFLVKILPLILPLFI